MEWWKMNEKSATGSIWYLAVTRFYNGCPLGDAMFTVGRQ